MRTVLLALLLLSPPVLAVDPAPAVDLTLAAGEPTGWEVPLHATMRARDAPSAEADLALDVTYEAPEGWTARWAEPWGRATAAPEVALDRAVLARYGAGNYTLVVVAGGSADGSSDPVRLALAEPGPVRADALVTWAGDGSPAVLTLTSDSVNADGKLKSPGEELVTRFVAEDADGLAPVDVVVRKADRVVATDVVPVPDATTRATLEHRFARSPIGAGEHVLTLLLDDANASRTFVIRDVRPTVLAEPPPKLVAGRTGEVPLVVADRNLAAGERGPGVLVAKLYRSTSPVAWRLAAGGTEGTGSVVVDLANATSEDASWRIVGDAGTLTRPVFVEVPADAVLATYRLAVYQDGVKVGEQTFEVTPPARIEGVAIVEARPGGVARVTGRADGLDAVHVTLSGAAEGETDAAVTNGTFEAAFSLPTGLAAGAPLHARVYSDGVEATAEGAVEDLPPSVSLVVRADGVARPPRALPGTELAVETAAVDPNGANVTVVVRLANSTGVTVAEAEGTVLRVPDGLARGLYSVEALATDATGQVGVAREPITVGPWVEAGFLDASVAARSEGDSVVARSRVVNTGNGDIGEVVVLVGDLGGLVAEGGSARLVLADGTAVEQPVAEGRARLGVAWPPGEATLEVRWPRAGTDRVPAASSDVVILVRGA